MTGLGRGMTVGNGSARSGAQRVATVLFAASALGEIGVGAGLLPFPWIAALLLGAPLDGLGLLVARALGGAALALGITWWSVRNDAHAVARCAPGFLIYNVAVGAVFMFQALQVSHPALPGIVGLVHLLAGGAFAAALAVARLSAKPSPSECGRDTVPQHETQ